MATTLYTITFSPTPGSLGTLIEYREDGGTDWIKPVAPANPTTLDSFPLYLELGKFYTIRVSAEGVNCVKKYIYVSVPIGGCCPDGYTLSPDGSYCFLEDDLPPSIVQSNICLAPSPLAGQYSSSGTALMDVGYDETLNGSFTLLTTGYWKEAPASVTGPMNREAVWVDTNCDGTKDALTLGQKLQITFPYTLPAAKTVYIGIGGDNTFQVDVNGVTVACVGTGSPLGPTATCNPANSQSSTANFNFWWLFPVNLNSGTNYITFSGIGDGSTNDALAAVIYDNTRAELVAATSDGDLNIIMQTSDYIGEHIDIATCTAGYFLDTSLGQGSYLCKKITQVAAQDCSDSAVVNIFARMQSTVSPPVAQIYWSHDSVTWTPTMLATVGTGNTFMVMLPFTPGDDLYFAARNNINNDIAFGVGNGGAFTGYCGEDFPYHYGIYDGSPLNLYFNLQVTSSAFVTC